MKLLHKFSRLSLSDFRLIIISVLVLNAVRLGLAFLPFRRLYQQTSKDSILLIKRSKRSVGVAKTVWAVNVASRYLPYPPKCLARALATQFLLRWQGHSSQFYIGVRKNGTGALAAHAWIMSEGKVVMGQISNLSQYVPLPFVEGRVAQSIKSSS